ncbi:MAG: transporter substrate-binding domain-containing protein [Gammaproteobacteria bacterium]|nr:transporter substrate-binding domain-containing protein [Gammaproteobacteria bacterium]
MKLALLFRFYRRFRISIRTVVIAFFLLVTVVTASVAISLQYYFSKTLATESTLAMYQKMATDTRNYLDLVDERASATARILAQFTHLTKDKSITDETRRLYMQGMIRNPLMLGVYLAFDNGDFYELVNLDSDQDARAKFHAQVDDRWLVITIKGQGKKRQRALAFYNEQFQLRATIKQATDYDPRRRVWYTEAKRGEIHKTLPYLFQALQKPGETYSIKLDKHNAVLAVDITMSVLSDYLRHQNLAEENEIYIYQETGQLVATNQLIKSKPLPVAPELNLTEQQQELVKSIPYLIVSNENDWPPINFAASGQPYGYAIDVLNYISQMTGIEIHYVNGMRWPDLADMFVNNELDVLQPVFYDKDRQWLGSLTDAFLEVPYGVITANGTAKVSHIDQLKGKTVAIPEGWLLATNLEEQFPDIKIIRVLTVRDMFNAVRQGKVDAAIDTAPILNYTAKQFFIEDVTISQSLDFGEVSFPSQLHFMLGKSKPGLTELFNLALSKLGSEYKQALQEKWFEQKGYQAQHDVDYQLGTVPYSELMQLVDTPSSDKLSIIKIKGVDHFVFTTRFGGDNGTRDIFSIVTPVSKVLAPGVEKVKMAIALTALASLLLLPLSWFLAKPFVDPIHQLAEDSRKITNRRYDEVQDIESGIKEIHNLGVSMHEMSHSIQEHEQAQRALMDAFIKLIAQAIDDKSPHTAGHCERVPHLAFMLIKEAEKDDSEPFGEFAFKSDEEWREFEIAAWLHDCGKIITPERIIDKGTKLETLYNRIHEIRMRFEVLWRDAEINYLLSTFEPEADDAALLIEKQQKQRQLQQDFAFLANANIGSEFMSDEDVTRLKELAQQTWQRHFDNRLGLSHVELSRCPEIPEELPVTESLLADKPEHLEERVRGTDYDPGFGIKMAIPEYLYNNGELYNLSIKSGTLTAEDRFKINEHIISTIKMLENLPFPEELKRVPRYASTHHESMKGTGYPRGLSGEELSIPERVMVLADIYEALTAADRPYKKAKPVSVAVDILYKMVQNEHVDVEVFELFLKTGVYRRYAQQFLPEEQIDDVDINQYLRAS